MRRLAPALFAVAAVATFASPASAQTYPSRPVTMVVPFPPGGNTDLMARALQTELTKALGQSVIISNKGGAAGTIGLLDLVRAEPDGYTMAMTPNNPITAQPHFNKELRYGMDTFRYVCLTYYTPYVLIAGPKRYRQTDLRRGRTRLGTRDGWRSRPKHLCVLQKRACN